MLNYTPRLKRASQADSENAYPTSLNGLIKGRVNSITRPGESLTGINDDELSLKIIPFFPGKWNQ